MSSPVLHCPVAIIGAGPAGLMAAEVLSATGLEVHVFDAMPSVGRKFLLAGIGGLNLTHAEPLPAFKARYGPRAEVCGRWLDAFGPQALRDWAAGLGIETFVGSSQRVFPLEMKAAPLLRAWLQRLRHPASGVPVRFHMRQRWDGQLQPLASATAAPGYRLHLHGPQGQTEVQARSLLLALGGGSWPKLGSDGAWMPWLAQHGVPLQPLRPSNCGFDVAVGARPGWSAHLRERCAGAALKGVLLRFTDAAGQAFERRGECVLTETGLEGSLIYAASARLRDTIEATGRVRIALDLKPDWSRSRLQAELTRERGGQSLGTLLRQRIGLTPAQVALLHEVLSPAQRTDPAELAALIQGLPLDLVATRPLAEAISSTGGVALEGLNEALMLHPLPGVFCAGEMLDWEAPTGGYLLSACLASGRVAGLGLAAWLQAHETARAATLSSPNGQTGTGA
ncbi:MAG: TIGR03862 family flavoprotein [Serpentinimonas sp.]|nr:TIGR03862 family flavoprotein [Serpentinimonas sp.]